MRQNRSVLGLKAAGGNGKPGELLMVGEEQCFFDDLDAMLLDFQKATPGTRVLLSLEAFNTVNPEFNPVVIY